MRWRDIRFEQPTEADGDSEGCILQLLRGGGVTRYDYDDLQHTVAWMPLSELPAFTPIPDPPEGWRFVEKGDAFDKRAKFWGVSGKEWLKLNRDLVEYPRLLVCIVPIDPPKPPEPQYRPYNDAELIQTIGKLVDGVKGYRAMITGACGDAVYCQGQKVSAEDLLKDHAWTDGSRCGVRIEQ
jgi:hypothetical protein